MSVALADPALASLPDGYTASRLFITREGVPIFDEGAPIDQDDKGTVTQRATVKDLEEIAANCNRRVIETGDETPIVIGHTKDKIAEADQPEIVGYAKDFYVQQFGKTGRKAIFATFRFFRDKFQKALQYPRRSVELLRKDKFIDPIALLGATTPERDLGLLYFQNHGERLRYQMTENSTEAPMDHNAIVAEILAALRETDVWKALEAKANVDAPPPPPEPIPTEEGDMPPADDATPPGEEDKNNYMAGMPSGTNTETPNMTYEHKCSKCGHNDKVIPEDQGGQPGIGKDSDDRARMHKDQERIRFSRLEGQVNDLQKENIDLKRRYRRAERERALIQLEGEGYMFDRAEELDSVADLSDDAFKVHQDRIRKRYQRAPIGDRLIATPSNVEGGKHRFSKEDMQEAVKIASNTGVSYTEALEKINRNGK